MRSIVLLSLLLSAAPLWAESETRESFKHIPIVDPPRGDRAVNFGTVYLIQWAAYLTTQNSIIKEHGSLEKYGKNLINPHFDNDNFDFNITQHTISGQYYYLFYRSRGYGIQSAFEWTALSSLAFEFTIETLTERPSYQDMYQTPVFGTIVGMGFEKLSLYLHSLQTLPTTVLAYMVDPFTLLPSSQYKLGFYPTLSGDKVALGLTIGAAL